MRRHYPARSSKPAKNPRAPAGHVPVERGSAGFVSDNKTVTNRFSADNGKTIVTLAQWQALGHDKKAAAGCDAVIAAATNPK
jgi:hypothetical protein